jgi:hypothetical protein
MEVIFMSEVSIDNDAQTTQNGDGQEVQFEPVCIEVPRIYDSCGAKDCLRDLTVFFTAEDQDLVETAASVRVTKASVLTANISVDSVAFNRGYYAVDVVFYIAVGAEVYTGRGTLPATVTGLQPPQSALCFTAATRTRRFSRGIRRPRLMRAILTAATEPSAPRLR